MCVCVRANRLLPFIFASFLVPRYFKESIKSAQVRKIVNFVYTLQIDIAIVQLMQVQKLAVRLLIRELYYICVESVFSGECGVWSMWSVCLVESVWSVFSGECV